MSQRKLVQRRMFQLWSQFRERPIIRFLQSFLEKPYLERLFEEWFQKRIKNLFRLEKRLDDRAG